jgi:hypothetical protein
MSSLPGYYSTAEAAAALGISQSAVKDAIGRHALAVIRSAGRNFISGAEIERYRCAHLGRGGWQTRRQPGYVPNERRAERQRAYYQRKKARRQAEARTTHD